jgi:hypothetical protein
VLFFLKNIPPPVSVIKKRVFLLEKHVFFCFFVNYIHFFYYFNKKNIHLKKKRYFCIRF